MKFLVFYITDRIDTTILTSEEAQVISTSIISQQKFPDPNRVDYGAMSPSVSEIRKRMRAVSQETEVRLRGHDMWELDDGVCVKHFVAFDTSSAPPTLVFAKLDMHQLRLLEAALPSSWMNRYGSIIGQNGETIMKSDEEPPEYPRYGGFAGVTSSGGLYTVGNIGSGGYSQAVPWGGQGNLVQYTGSAQPQVVYPPVCAPQTFTPAQQGFISSLGDIWDGLKM